MFGHEVRENALLVHFFDREMVATDTSFYRDLFCQEYRSSCRSLLNGIFPRMFYMFNVVCIQYVDRCPTLVSRITGANYINSYVHIYGSRYASVLSP